MDSFPTQPAGVVLQFALCAAACSETTNKEKGWPQALKRTPELSFENHFSSVLSAGVRPNILYLLIIKRVQEHI